jgi:Lrp/AsnC family leucine-responsive transcriptional regulator
VFAQVVRVASRNVAQNTMPPPVPMTVMIDAAARMRAGQRRLGSVNAVAQYRIDATDRKLLDLLRDNARLSYAELARQIGLSAPAVHERVGKLESTGIIRGYRADVEPEAIGLGVTALIGLVQSADTDTEELIERLFGVEEIESCYFLAGAESFLVKVRVGDIGELERLLVRLNRTSGVASSRTTIALSTKWENRPRPAPHPDR